MSEKKRKQDKRKKEREGKKTVSLEEVESLLFENGRVEVVRSETVGSSKALR